MGGWVDIMVTRLDRQPNFLSYAAPLVWSSANNIIKYVVKKHKHRLKNWSYEPAVTQHHTMQAHWGQTAGLWP